MRTYLKNILAISLSVLLASCTRDGPLLLNAAPGKLSHSLTVNIPKLMSKHNIPGMSVVVINEGKVVVSKSFGYSNVESRRRVSEGTIYKAASLGKPVFAYIVVKLSQQGKIDLDKPLFDYIGTRIIKNDQRSEGITARMVLSHSSGLPNFGVKPTKFKFHFNPGTKFKYSGHGYLYLQKVVEKITGKQLEKLAKEIVFEPLKMTKSSYRWRKEYINNISSSYDENMKKYVVKTEPLVGYAAWSLFTTISDYSKFVSHIINTSRDRKSVASLLLEPNIKITENLNWGMGWGIQKTTPNESFWHWGSKSGFRHYVVGYPKEGLAVIVMSNSREAFKMIDAVMAMSIGGSYPSYDWF